MKDETRPAGPERMFRDGLGLAARLAIGLAAAPLVGLALASGRAGRAPSRPRVEPSSAAPKAEPDAASAPSPERQGDNPDRGSIEQALLQLADATIPKRGRPGRTKAARAEKRVPETGADGPAAPVGKRARVGRPVSADSARSRHA